MTFFGLTLSPDTLALLLGMIGLASLIMRTTARIDRRMDRFEDRFEDAMATFRSEMLRIAERQARVEGRLDERGAPAD